MKYVWYNQWNNCLIRNHNRSFLRIDGGIWLLLRLLLLVLLLLLLPYYSSYHSSSSSYDDYNDDSYQNFSAGYFLTKWWNPEWRAGATPICSNFFCMKFLAILHYQVKPLGRSQGCREFTDLVVKWINGSWSYWDISDQNIGSGF